MQNQENQIAYSRLFRNKSFVALWIGQTVSFVGDYFYWLAIPILVERMTGSSLLVGLSVISTALPMLVLGPIAGVFVDRWNRKWTMLAADILRAALVLLCLTVRSPEQLWIYYVVGFLMSCVSRFFFPAQNAVLPLIVTDKNDLLAANGLMQIVQTAGLLIGPALAGFTIGLWGEQIAFLVDASTFVVSALMIVTMTVPHTTGGQQADGRQMAAIWAEMRDGVTYLFGNGVMLGILICLSVVQLGMGAIHVLWVPFLQRTFGLGPEGLGAVDTAQGIGMALGGMALGAVAARFRKRDLASWGIVLAGGIVVLFGTSPSFSLVNAFPGLSVAAAPAEMTIGQRLLHMPLLLLAYNLLLGIVLVPIQSALMTMMQLAVPDLKRGRVGSALNAVTMAAGLVSMAVASSLGEVFSLRTLYIIAGVLTGLGGIVGMVVLQEPEQTSEQPDVEVPVEVASSTIVQ